MQPRAPVTPPNEIGRKYELTSPSPFSCTSTSVTGGVVAKSLPKTPQVRACLEAVSRTAGPRRRSAAHPRSWPAASPAPAAWRPRLHIHTRKNCETRLRAGICGHRSHLHRSHLHVRCHCISRHGHCFHGCNPWPCAHTTEPFVCPSTSRASPQRTMLEKTNNRGVCFSPTYRGCTPAAATGAAGSGVYTGVGAGVRFRSGSCSQAPVRAAHSVGSRDGARFWFQL